MGEFRCKFRMIRSTTDWCEDTTSNTRKKHLNMNLVSKSVRINERIQVCSKITNPPHKYCYRGRTLQNNDNPAFVLKKLRKSDKLEKASSEASAQQPGNINKSTQIM